MGGEMEVWLSSELALRVGTREGAVLTIENAAALLASPSGLCLVLAEPAVAPGSVVVTVGATSEDGDPVTGTATFSFPAWLAVSAGTPYRSGLAVDVEFEDDVLIRAITSITAPTGVIVELWSLPSMITFSKVGCTTNKEFTFATEIRSTPTAAPGARSHWIPASELTVRAKLSQYGDTLSAFHRSTCCALIKVAKEVVVTEHIFVLNWTPGAISSAGDGEDEAFLSATGAAETTAILMAP